ncbi:MAG TPA: glycosyltransferase [Flavobacteriales bacterium]|nr:glycosyltransferase [Flavobacteriales bacterium]
MKRVLIIAYYWPPNAGVGVFRWLKFTKYLPQFDWQPVIYTPENPELMAVDPSLEKQIPAGAEIIKAPIIEPYAWYKRFTGKKSDDRLQTAFLKEDGGGPTWKENVANWVRSNFFIPDARVWWVKPSVTRLLAYLKAHPVDVIVTTGSPHSLHLIGRELKKRTGIPWVADFRDPWTNIDFYGQLKLTKWADAEQHKLERAVLSEADRVITVSWRWAEELKALGAKQVDVITNGFDPDDLPAPPGPVDDAWSLVHVGSISATRNVPELWRALAERAGRDPEFRSRFKLRLIGGVDHTVQRDLEAAGLGPYIERIGQVDHTEAMRQMQRARVLLLPVNDTPNVGGFLPAKVFEYLAVQRPILAVAPLDADIVRVLGKGHRVVPRGGTSALRSAVDALFSDMRTEGTDISLYERRALTAKLADLLDAVRRH